MEPKDADTTVGEVNPENIITLAQLSTEHADQKLEEQRKETNTSNELPDASIINEALLNGIQLTPAEIAKLVRYEVHCMYDEINRWESNKAILPKKVILPEKEPFYKFQSGDFYYQRMASELNFEDSTLSKDLPDNAASPDTTPISKDGLIGYLEFRVHDLEFEEIKILKNGPTYLPQEKTEILKNMFKSKTGTEPTSIDLSLGMVRFYKNNLNEKIDQLKKLEGDTVGKYPLDIGPNVETV
jgi:hypothetical protein